MANLPEGVEPLDRSGPFCDEKHPTAPSLRCMKRPGHAGPHVAWHTGQRVEWPSGLEIREPVRALGPDERQDPAGFRDLRGFPTGGLRNPARAAQRMPDMKEAGFTGDICEECGAAMMTRNGSCLKCNACGATTGCS